MDILDREGLDILDREGLDMDILDVVEDLENVKMLRMKKDVVVLKVLTANTLNQIWKTKIKKLRHRLKTKPKIKLLSIREIAQLETNTTYLSHYTGSERKHFEINYRDEIYTAAKTLLKSEAPGSW